MKKQILLLGTFLAFGVGFSQNIFPTAAGTNVGIGTTAPSTRLQVTSATAGTSGIRMTNLTSSSATSTANNRALSVDTSGNVVLVSVPNTDTSLYSTDGTLSLNRTVTMNARNLTFNPSTANSQFFINGTSGNVGLGTINPTAKLEIIGSAKANLGIFTSNLIDGQSFTSVFDRNDKSIVLSAGKVIGTGTGYTNTRMFNFYDFPESNLDAKSTVFFGIEDRGDVGRYRFIAQRLGSTQMIMNNKSQQEIMKIFEDGNDNVTMTLPKTNSFLGIGTTSFIDGTDTFRLAVKGAIRADRVKVYTSWADFVFEKNYDLPSLEEVEKHIKEKGHLKDIPSAKEVDKNGIELGEMNKKLLQKIEELTLYLIEMNKELQEVKSQIKKV